MATYKDMLLDIIQPTTERQYGGGLDDAYMTLSQRRSSAFADPNANSAFASPMSQGGLPTIYRQDGGTTIPKERMINDQPHQLSYINPEEAGLLQALGGSGRRVDGIPSYYYSMDDGTGSEDYDDGTGSENYSDLGFSDNINESVFGQEATGVEDLGGFDGNTFYEFDQADADAGAAGRATSAGEEPDYTSYDSGGRAIQSNTPADVALDVLNQRAAMLGGERYRDRFDDLGPINPNSKLTNLQLAQRGIDRDLYNKAGVPLAQFLENRGLATFGKGMRGPFEAYTPGDALYRYEDKDSLAAGRGVYEPSLLTGTLDEDVSPAARELDMRMRYAKEGETVADITAQMTKETELSPEAISQAALDFGYSTNSTAQASQVYESLNDARGKGMLSGLGIIAGGIMSPSGFVHSMLSDYDDDGNVSSPMGKAFNSFAESTGIKGVANKLGMGGDNTTLDAAGNVIDFLQRGPGSIEVEPARTGVPSMVPVDEGFRGINSEDGFGSREASTESSKTSFGDSVSKFLTDTFGPGDGMITQPSDPIEYGNDSSPPKEIRRRQQDQSQQVAVILKAVAETPVEVKRSIEERGLTPQYLALIRAGYTAEEAIKAVGAPAGTALT